MSIKSFQDYYPDELSHCYGCGTNNDQGHQLKSFWLNDFLETSEHETKDAIYTLLNNKQTHNNSLEQTISVFEPSEKHTAIPGFVYGGLLASLIDCHGTGSASAMSYRYANREIGSKPVMRFVTAGLNIRYLAPTPQGAPLILMGNYVEVKERKIVVDILVYANNTLCVSGQVVAVLMPDTMMNTTKAE